MGIGAGSGRGGERGRGRERWGSGGFFFQVVIRTNFAHTRVNTYRGFTTHPSLSLRIFFFFTHKIKLPR